jgi:heme exporter protein A
MTPNQNKRQLMPTSDTADMCLHIEALTVLRGQRVVIDRLTHKQNLGQLCILTGANGAGKSTLLRSIAGQLPAESGHIAYHLPRIYIGHADGLAGAISGRKNLQVWAAVNDITLRGDNLEQALAGFDANEFADMPVQLLSRGQRRRLALARLLLAPSPSIWLLDEPNTGLDQDSQTRLETAIANHLLADGAVIAATHSEMASSSAKIHLSLGL